MGMDIGVIGMGVMGKNLAMNIRDKGFKVSVYNRTVEKMNGIDDVKKCYSIQEFVNSLAKRRKILLMINQDAVHEMVINLRKYCDKDDLIVDCGNTYYKLSENLGICNCGVSGGEEGARKGPSMMFGGKIEDWEVFKPIFNEVSAKNEFGEPCCGYMGEGGAGHYVKMVHNGIEYSIMEILSEIFLLKGNFDGLKNIFNSYLLEICEKILKYPERLKEIKDSVSQKGTGMWTLQSAAEESPCPILASAVFSRKISCMSETRSLFQKNLKNSILNDNKNFSEEDIKKAYKLAIIMAYIEGLMLIKKHLPNLDIKTVLKTWSNGCIIRSSVLKELVDMNDYDNELLILNINQNLDSLRKIVIYSVTNGISIPGLSTTLEVIDSLRNENIAVLMALMRDYFGAHGVTLKDGTTKHYKWD